MKIETIGNDWLVTYKGNIWITPKGKGTLKGLIRLILSK